MGSRLEAGAKERIVSDDDGGEPAGTASHTPRPDDNTRAKSQRPECQHLHFSARAEIGRAGGLGQLMAVPN